MTPSTTLTLRRESEPDLSEVLRECGVGLPVQNSARLVLSSTKRFHANRRERIVLEKLSDISCQPLTSKGFFTRDNYKLRVAMLARDRGVCALCGFNCLEFAAAINFVKRRLEKNCIGWDCRFKDFLAVLGRRAQKYPNALWEAHRLVPGSELGRYELENTVTACFVCHSKETNRLIYRKSGEREAAV